MKVDKLLKRKTQPVKAIRTYNPYFTIHSTDEMGSHNEGILNHGGEGLPRLLVDIKFNESRGREIDLVFMGARETRKNFNPDEKQNWKSFGHIVMSPEQAVALAVNLLEMLR